jgi:predicted metal-dependent hydrolase
VRRVDIGGRVVEIPVRISPRARKLTIHVDAHHNVEIVVPKRTTQDEIDALLFEHRAWLERQLSKPKKQFHLGLQRDDVVWIGGLALRTPRVASLDRWYREQAREEITRVVEHEAKRLDVTYTRLSIRDQRTRWGSCTRAGSLSFNWRLVLAPSAVLSYVVVHELCHRIRHDHSPEFWALVAESRPTYTEERAWLHEHGPELLAYEVPVRRAA